MSARAEITTTTISGTEVGPGRWVFKFPEDLGDLSNHCVDVNWALSVPKGYKLMQIGAGELQTMMDRPVIFMEYDIDDQDETNLQST